MVFVDHIDAIGAYLVESWQKTVTIDMEKYDRMIKDHIEDLYYWSRERHPDEEDWDYKKWTRDMQADAIKRMAKIASMIARVLGNLDLGIHATVVPFIMTRKNWDTGEERLEYPDKVPSYATIYFHKGSNRKAGSPSLTWFGPKEVDDVLDAGDTDFFDDPELEAAYFAVVNELRSPGSSKRKGKMVKVYTARPKKDRRLYDGAKEVPSGIFVTNDADRAYGFGRDFGSTKEGRDLWRIVVDSKRLVQTLKAGRIRDYQLVGKGKVPIKEIERIA